MSNDKDFGRVDLTYWPQTGAVEWHGHADLEGDGPLLRVSPELLAKALEAIAAEQKRAAATARWWDRRVLPCR